MPNNAAQKRRKLRQKRAIAETVTDVSFLGGLGSFLAGNLIGNTQFNLFGTAGFSVGVLSEFTIALVELTDRLDRLKNYSFDKKRRAIGEFIAKFLVAGAFSAGLIQYFMSDTNSNPDEARAENFGGTLAFAVGIFAKILLTIYYTKRAADNPEVSKKNLLISILLHLAENAGFVAGVTLFTLANRTSNHSTYGFDGIMAFTAGVAVKTVHHGMNMYNNWSRIFGRPRQDIGLGQATTDTILSDFSGDDVVVIVNDETTRLLAGNTSSSTYTISRQPTDTDEAEGAKTVSFS